MASVGEAFVETSNRLDDSQKCAERISKVKPKSKIRFQVDTSNVNKLSDRETECGKLQKFLIMFPLSHRDRRTSRAATLRSVDRSAGKSAGAPSAEMHPTDDMHFDSR